METQNIEQQSSGKTRSYIHITWGNVGRFFLALGMAGLAILNFILIIQVWITLGLGELSDKQSYSWAQLAIYWVLIGEYVIVSATAICLVALIMTSFRNLNPAKKDELIYELIIGLIYGLIYGLIIGLIGGLVGLIIELIGGLVGLIFGLIVGLIFGLIGGLLAGLLSYLDEEQK